MFTKFKKSLCILLCILISTLFLNGCNSEEKYVLYFELDSAPSTLDPQLVRTSSEELLVKNLFEGLMRENEKGEVVKGAASDYAVSDDGKTYTFTLREGAKWSDDKPLKGEDFVFAFERAVDPKNKAPNVALLYSIVGAKDIAEGKNNTALGVTSTNDKNVTITLNSPDPNFLRTLSTAICMPCRKDVYNKARGQYGIVPEQIVTNGSFKIRFWDKGENFSFRINKFADYNGSFIAEASAVIFSVGNISGRALRIDEANLDMGFINISEATDKSNLFSYEKSSYILLINEKSTLGGKDFRKAFAKSIHRNRLKNELGKEFKESTCLIPNTVLLNGTPLSSKIKNTAPPSYDPNAAYSLYISAAKNTKDMPKSVNILYYGNDAVKALAQLVAENMQQSLGAVVNATPTSSEAELISSVKNNEYTLAIIPLNVASGNPSQFFEVFTKNSNNNIYGFKNQSYDKAVEKIKPNSSEQTIIEASEAAIKTIISNTTIIPLAMHLEAFSYSKAFELPTISPFGGVVDLALVKKI